MLKKTITAAAIAGFLVLGGSSAAFAYPDEDIITADDVTLTVGAGTTVRASGLDGLDTVYFGTTSAGATLSSIVFAAAPSEVAKSVADDNTASAQFSASTAGSFDVYVRDEEGTVLDTVTISVAAVGTTTPTTPSTGLPATGSELPAAAIWIGVGAIGIGGIAVAAGVARRRASVSK